MLPLLYVERALPGRDAAARCAFAREHGLALEVREDPELLRVARAERVPVLCLQAYRLHEQHALCATAAERAAGREHLASALRLAAEQRVPRVLAVCGFGPALAPDPEGSALEQFAAVAPAARAAGLRVLIERLSPLRAGALTSAAEHARLHAALRAPECFGSCLDTGHLLDAGLDPERAIADWPLPLDELQLRGPLGSAPGPELPLERWIAAARGLAAVAIEHREPLAPAACAALVARVRAALP